MKKEKIKGIISKTKARHDVKFINLKAITQVHLKNHNTTLRQVSLRMGQGPNYLTQEMAKKDHSIALLLTLSRQLNINLIEPFLVLLPTDIRMVKNEKLLAEQLLALQKQLDDVTKERDWLKEVVMKKG